MSGFRRRQMMNVGGDEWDQYAIQTLDSTKPNYNPAVAIILYENGIGDVFQNPINNEGRYFLTKEKCSQIQNIGTSYKNCMFSEKTIVTDIHGIVTNNTNATYNFTSFDEFQYFTNVKNLPHCANAVTLVGGGPFTKCTQLQSIILPSTLEKLGEGTFGCCQNLSCELVIPPSITIIPASCFCQTACHVILHDNITTFDGGAFQPLNSGTEIYPTINKIPANLTTLKGCNYYHIYTNDYTLPRGCVNMTYGRGFFGNTDIGNAVHWLMPSLTNATYQSINSYYYAENVNKIYVGDGTSESHDNNILAEYVSHLPNIRTKLDTWYNYLQLQL